MVLHMLRRAEARIAAGDVDGARAELLEIDRLMQSFRQRDDVGT
jgi:hypothetical protein